jgi:hypothetical protein
VLVDLQPGERCVNMLMHGHTTCSFSATQEKSGLYARWPFEAVVPTVLER